MEATVSTLWMDRCAKLHSSLWKEMDSLLKSQTKPSPADTLRLAQLGLLPFRAIINLW